MMDLSAKSVYLRNHHTLSVLVANNVERQGILLIRFIRFLCAVSVLSVWGAKMDGENLNLDYVVRFASACYMCEKPLPRHPRVLYCLSGRPMKRLCRACYMHYKSRYMLEKKAVVR